MFKIGYVPDHNGFNQYLGSSNFMDNYSTFYGPVSCSPYTECFVKDLLVCELLPLAVLTEQTVADVTRISIGPPSIIDNGYFKSSSTWKGLLSQSMLISFISFDSSLGLDT